MVTEPGSKDWQGVWSPGGRAIAFTSDRSGNDDIYTMDLTTGEITQITEDAAKDSDPSWSPDGSQIAFTSARDGAIAVWVMNADGSDARMVARNAAKPHWHPDGDLLVGQGYPEPPELGVAIITIDLKTGATEVVSR